MTRTGCLAMVLAVLVVSCSSGGTGSGTSSTGAGGNATGGTGAPSQSATGSGGMQQAGGRSGGGGASSVGGGGGIGGMTGLAGATVAGGNSTEQGGGSSGLGSTTGVGGSTTGMGGNSSGAGSTAGVGGDGLGGATSVGGTTGVGGTTSLSGGTTGAGGTTRLSGGTTGGGGTTGQGGSTTGLGGSGGMVSSGGTSSSAGTGGRSTTTSSGGTTRSGGVVTTAGSSATGGSGGNGGSSATGGSTGTSTCGAAAGSGPIGVLTDPGPGSTDPSPPDPPGITFTDTDGDLVDAHGGGIIQVCDTFYLHGEYFLSTTTDNDFNGFSMYSSKNLATWKKEGNNGIILPQQPSGQLGPNRKGERPHIIKCPATGEFVLYAHSADVTYEVDKEVVYATSPTVNAVYSFKGSLLSSTGAIAAHSDMSAFADETGAYVVTESGWVYTLASDCHSWVSSKQFSVLNGTTGGIEAPTVFKDNSGTYYFIGSDKTGWRANDDFYSTAKSMNGPWTYQGYIAPQGKLTWMTQSTWVQPIVGSQGTVFMYWGDHWYGNQDTTAPGVHNYLATYVFQPLVFNSGTTLLPTYLASWQINVGAGTWSQ
ncbi:MAG: family 43 glycosylhydrolase [Polyangia bacterium]